MAYIKLLRVSQWLKNGFVLAPLFFALQITHLTKLYPTLLAFVLFSLAASSIYIINDYLDIEEDRRHPRKKFRPLAAGKVGKGSALAYSGLLATIAIGGGFLQLRLLGFILATYVVMNLAYSYRLKHVALIDISIISFGFLLRIAAGAAVSQVPITKWIIIITFLLALFLAIAKRRSDLILAEDGQNVRKCIDGYSIELINVSMTFFAAVIVVCYIMYCTSPIVVQRLGSENLYFTSLFVVMGILRYFQITLVKNKSGSPTELLLTDNFLQVTILSWVATFVVLIYL